MGALQVLKPLAQLGRKRLRRPDQAFDQFLPERFARLRSERPCRLVEGVDQKLPEGGQGVATAGAVDGAGVLVGFGPGRASSAQELHGGQEAVQVGVRDDRVHLARSRHDFGRHQLGTGVRLAIGDEQEARVVAHPGPSDRMLVMVDPDRQAVAHRVEKGDGDLFEVVPARERHVEHGDAAIRSRREIAGLFDENDAHVEA